MLAGINSVDCINPTQSSGMCDCIQFGIVVYSLPGVLHCL